MIAIPFSYHHTDEGQLEDACTMAIIKYLYEPTPLEKALVAIRVQAYAKTFKARSIEAEQSILTLIERLEKNDRAAWQQLKREADELLHFDETAKNLFAAVTTRRSITGLM